MWTTDIEMIDDWIEETNQPYDTLFSEKDDGIYIVDKNWEETMSKDNGGGYLTENDRLLR